MPRLDALTGAETVREAPAASAGPAAATPASRLLALDGHRGLILVIMALDHASSMVARAHVDEWWATPLPIFASVFWFLNRWLSHLCAPGFLFLMGISMILLAEARRKEGWRDGQIIRFFVLRGMLLIALDVFFFMWAWVLTALTATPGAGVQAVLTPHYDPPGTVYEGGMVIVVQQLLVLGGGMVFWAFLLRAPKWLIIAVSLAAVVITQLVTPGAEQRAVEYPVIVRLLLIPGNTGILWVRNPLIPWLSATGLGVLFGQLLRQDPRRAGRSAGWTGLAFLGVFALTRITGLSNFNPPPPGWMGLLTATKYPPDIAYLSMTLGITLLLMSGWHWIESYLHRGFHPLITFGRSALFFYLLHIWIYSIIGALFFRGGAGLLTLYAVWLLGLVILYPLCRWYGNFKRTTPVTSIWRFF